MPAAKIAITLDRGTLARINELVKKRTFPNRSRAIATAVRENLERLERGRIADECATLEPAREHVLAEEGMTEDLPEWPEY